MTEQAAAEKDGTVGNDENLIKPPSPTSTLSTTATIINDQPNKIEEYVDSAPRGREDDTLEGSEIKTSSNFDNNWSDTSSEVINNIIIRMTLYLRMKSRI